LPISVDTDVYVSLDFVTLVTFVTFVTKSQFILNNLLN
jgi:hypothetical protein